MPDGQATVVITLLAQRVVSLCVCSGVVRGGQVYPTIVHAAAWWVECWRGNGLPGGRQSEGKDLREGKEVAD